jgi:DNA-directed RNA polymerase beta subunit
VAVEPHSAKQDEISTVIKKRTAAREQLKAHLHDVSRVTTWLWVASGKVHFANTEKARVRLDQNGIEFVGTRVTAKHLPIGSVATQLAGSRAKPKAKRG